MRRITRPRRNRRSGSALALALLAVTVVAMLGAGFVSVSSSIARRQHAEVEKMHAFYVAEAGLAEAFQALRIARSGQIGSVEEPAVFGDGLVWVDAIDTVDQQVRLTSNALYGTGRASLGLVVEPIEIPLGFFGTDAVIVESIVLVDGFNSDQGLYTTQLSTPTVTIDPLSPTLYDDWVNGILLYDNHIYKYDSRDGDTYVVDFSMETSLYLGELNQLVIDPIKTPELGWDPMEGHAGYPSVVDLVLEYADTVPETSPRPSSTQGPTTGSGGLISSNGDIIFQNAAGDIVEVFGDVIPGPDGTIVGADDALIAGSTDSRQNALDLPEVEVPNVSLLSLVRHEGVLPMLIAPGTVGYEAIEVAADAELVVRGPATLVLGRLDLEPGATMTLDTRDGDVSLYVTEGMNLEEGSFVTTTGHQDGSSSIQVSEIPRGEEAPVQLNATSAFHGTIYSPATDVCVGGNFEVFGSVVASKLLIGAGARLHHDDIGFDGTPIPRTVSWRIVEVPQSVANMQDPWRALGVEEDDLLPLEDAHDLASVQLRITYIGLFGAEHTFEGLESDFDWDQVSSVISMERDPIRKSEAPDDVLEAEDLCKHGLPKGADHSLLEDTAAGDAPADLPTGIRQEVQSLVNATTDSGFFAEGAIFTAIIEDHHPLSAEEWQAIDDIPGDMSAENRQKMHDRDIAAGGTGGL